MEIISNVCMSDECFNNIGGEPAREELTKQLKEPEKFVKEFNENIKNLPKEKHWNKETKAGYSTIYLPVPNANGELWIKLRREI
jgi:hypothetical protein